MSILHRAWAFLVVFIVALGVARVHAATVAWGPATDVVNSSDVATNGAYVDALYTVSGGADQTVNGTVFHGQAGGFTPTVSPTSFTGTTAQITLQTTGPSPTSYFGNGAENISLLPSGVTGSYVTILSGNDYGYDNDSDGLTYVHHGTITLSGLIVGDRYQVQVWSIQPDGQHYVTTYTSGSNTVSLSLNPGQYVLGTFIADAVTESFTFVRTAGNADYYAVNAVALRVLPEPASFGILSLGAVVVLGARRRQGKV